MQRKASFFLVAFLLLNHAAKTQQDPPAVKDSLIQSIAGFLSAQGREKLLVRTDRLFYRSGETIYFKTYCINGITGRLDRESQVLFTDLVDDSDRVISQLYLNNSLFKTEGAMVLPEELQEGQYFLRTYSHQSLQGDSTAMVVTHLFVYNPKAKHSSISRDGLLRFGGARDNNRFQANFFPEGGSIIGGTDQRVAFTILDARDSPTAASGYLRNNANFVVARFKSSGDGYGVFDFFANNDEKYIAHVGSTEEQSIGVQLPPANARGARLSMIKETDSSYHFLVALGDSLLFHHLKTILVGVQRGRIFFAGVGVGMYETEVSKKEIPAGAVDFLLFDEKKKLLSQRSLAAGRGSVVEVGADQTHYGPRALVKLGITVSDESHQPVLTLLSVSVTNDKYTRQSTLTASDSNDPLMAFVPNEIYGSLNVPAVRLRDEFGPSSIQGRLLDKKGQPLARLVVTLFSGAAHQALLFGQDTSDATGHFRFDLPRLTDSVSFQLQVNNLKGVQQQVSIVLDSARFPEFNTPEQLKTPFDGSTGIFLDHLLGGKLDTLSVEQTSKMLKAVTVRAVRKQPVNYDETKRISLFSRIVSWDMIHAGVNGVQDALLMVPGMRIVNGNLSIHGGAPPLLVIDGVPQDIANLSSVPTESIEFIEVLTGPESSFYGLRGMDGAIVINTRSGARKYFNGKETSLPYFTIRGFPSPRSFAGPDYSIGSEKNKTEHDRRATLYWNGDLLTDANGKASIEFYTADDPADYTVTVFGITAAGEKVSRSLKIHRD